MEENAWDSFSVHVCLDDTRSWCSTDQLSGRVVSMQVCVQRAASFETRKQLDVIRRSRGYDGPSFQLAFLVLRHHPCIVGSIGIRLSASSSLSN